MVPYKVSVNAMIAHKIKVVDYKIQIDEKHDIFAGQGNSDANNASYVNHLKIRNNTISNTSMNNVVETEVDVIIDIDSQISLIELNQK